MEEEIKLSKIKKVLSDPYLIEKFENYKTSFFAIVCNKVPLLGEILSINSNALQSTQLTKIEDDLEYIKKTLEKIKERDNNFIQSLEFRKFITEIINQISQSSDKERRHAYANLLINGISIMGEINNKMMYLNTMNNLTTNHITVLSFFMNPELFCKNINIWPGNSSRTCSRETILKEIFKNYDLDIIRQTIIDLARLGIIDDYQTKFNNAVDTLNIAYPIPSSKPEDSPIIKEVLSKFQNGLTGYGDKFTKYLILNNK
jgi:hypothetical protein